MNISRVILFLFIVTALLFLSVSNSACYKDNITPDDDLIIYKIDPAYADKVAIQLSDDKKRIISYPAPGYEISQPVILLKNNYRLNGNIRGPNTAYISLNFEQYDTFFNSPHENTVDTLMKLILDDDPFIEYWYRYNYGPFHKNTNDAYLDTAMINQVILDEELGKYFTRLK
jgi:hypothetical protein